MTISAKVTTSELKSALEQVTTLELESALERYASALNDIDKTKPDLSEQTVLEVLVARDGVFEALSEKTTASTDCFTKLVELDNRLKEQTKTIFETGKLVDWRASFNPPTEAWWWSLEAHPEEDVSSAKEEIDKSKSLDPLFNGLTVVGLTAVAAFLTTFSQMFSTGGINPLETFGLLGQGGLVIATIGSLRGAGKDAIQSVLKKLHIPPNLHSQFTFGVSGLLLLGSIGFYCWLPQLSEQYFKKGQEFYEKGQLKKAEQTYKQALKLDPEDSKINVALGLIYESIGDLGNASVQYKIAMQKGSVQAFNNLGRVNIQQGDLVTANTLLLMGLQRVKDQDINTEYQLYRNRGWALLKQEKYKRAEQALKKAIELDKQIPEKQIGGGMAYCLLGKALEAQDKTESAQQQWQYCQEFARPETINEYKWFIEAGRSELAEKVDTTSIMQEEQSPSDKAQPSSSPEN